MFATVLLKNWKPLAIILALLAICFTSYQAGASRERLKCDSQLQEIKINEQENEIELQNLQIQSKQNVIKIKTLQNQVANSTSYHTSDTSRLEFLQIIFSEQS